MTERSLIKENLDEIRKKMEKAQQESPYGQNICLLAATKTVSPDRINYATHELGITDIGENRVQELLSKYDELDLKGVNLHFIGRLQSNKVKYIVDKVTMIHSVDSIKLAKEIDKQAAKIGKVMDILIEINSGNEENKGGISADGLDAFLNEVLKLSSIKVRGLMTIAPICEKQEEYKQFFDKTYRLSVDILKKRLHNIDSEVIISMGMSDSFEEAIRCGSTLVRIGTSIFGKRI
ncbi:MAG: YggS family pyridoxal phosphate-dependent enzyme [Ruminococcaceae bacterium]|nr:YggS family pyridoxal phosphate-dependent enzyme [Oscillospiraceae bacterium]